MIRVVLLGAGNVATHLSKAFSVSEKVELIQVYSRTKSSLQHFDDSVDTTTDLNAIKKADIYIIAIADDAVAEFSSQLNLKNCLVAHTSGSVPMDDLDNKLRKGVFYPLQTFSKNKKVDYNDIPICIEASTDGDLILLEKLASCISSNVFFIDSQQRKSLHAAAVFVNNFTNHMYHIGNEICNENKVPFEVLEPLIQETAKKILDLSPYEAQTGPAKRKDTHTISKHLEFVPEKYQEIYSLLTKSISNTYE